MDIREIQAILKRHTVLVRQPPHILKRDGLLDLRIVNRSTRLWSEEKAKSQGLTVVRFPGIGVGVRAEAGTDADKVSQIMLIQPDQDQSEMTALAAMTWIPADGLDLSWRLRLAAFGHLVSGWKLSSDGREVIWRLTVTTTPSAEREAIIARSMLQDAPKKNQPKAVPKRRPRQNPAK